MASRHSLRETQNELNYQGRIVPYTLRYMKQRKKTIGMKVKRNGEVEVLAPTHCCEAQVELFVSARAPWIIAKIDEFASVQSNTKSNNISYLGEQYELNIQENAPDYAIEFHTDEQQNKSVSISLAALTNASVNISPEDHARAYLDAWYKQQAHKIFSERLEYFSQQLPWVKRRPPLKIRKMKTRWGSCSSKGNINLNLHLIKAPLHCIDEVICHELCHLQQMNHSPAFYALMDRHLPNWKVSSDYLKAFAREHIQYD